MSGAAVFCLDRLVGVQRRQLNQQDASSIEARRISALFAVPAFLAVAADKGIVLDDQWQPGTTSLPRGLLEIHGPDKVPLLSPIRFHVRSQGWEHIDYSFVGAKNELAQQGSVAAKPITDIFAFFSDAPQSPTPCQLKVTAQGEGETTSTLHTFHLAPSIEADLADAYEVALEASFIAYGMGSPARQIRAGRAAEVGLKRIRNALSEGLDPRVAQALRAGTSLALQFLGTEVQGAEVRLYQHGYVTPDDWHDESKHARYRAECERDRLRALGLGLTEGRPRAELDPAYPVLGFPDHAAFKRYVDPTLEDLLKEPSDFTRGLLALMLEAPSVDVESSEWPAPVHGELFDLVNALVTAGWAYFKTLSGLALTPIGRVQAAKVH